MNTAGEATPDAATGRGRSSAAPWFLGLAVLLLLVAGAVTLLRSRDVERYAPPTAGNPEQPIEALSGELPLAGGGRLVAQLTPLHSHPGGQSFEAESLRRRLKLTGGEPWRLHLRWDAGESPQGEQEAPGADLERDAAFSVGVSALELHDADGLAARVLAPEVKADGPADPVASLFATPTSGLGPGQALDVVLWGRRAMGRVELRGLAVGRGEPATIVLEAITLARAELERALTYQTRGDEVVQPGKPRAGGASDRRSRTRVPSDG
jgi:hypothetical protein